MFGKVLERAHERELGRLFCTVDDSEFCQYNTFSVTPPRHV